VEEKTTRLRVDNKTIIMEKQTRLESAGESNACYLVSSKKPSYSRYSHVEIHGFSACALRSDKDSDSENKKTKETDASI